MDSRTVEAEKSYARLDVFLAEALDVTRSAAKKLIEEGHVLPAEAGRAAGADKPSRPVAAGERFAVTVPPPQLLDLTPQDIPLDIVYEDNDLAVVNKPRGLTVHAGCGNLTGTLVNALLYRLKNLSSINGVVRPGIVHRIDKDTTGLLVVAKTDAAHLSLSAQIADKTCSRVYLALCDGVFGQDEGRIETYIGRHPTERTKMAVVPPAKGRFAATNYEVVRRFAAGYTLVRFRLETGRTHQIRVHCRHIGHPVVGDPVYGSKKQRFRVGGQLLHAERLSFTHPTTGERMTFTAPLPEDFAQVLEMLERTERRGREEQE